MGNQALGRHPAAEQTDGAEMTPWVREEAAQLEAQELLDAALLHAGRASSISRSAARTTAPGKS